MHIYVAYFSFAKLCTLSFCKLHLARSGECYLFSGITLTVNKYLCLMLIPRPLKYVVGTFTDWLQCMLFTARCTMHVVCPSICLSVYLSWPHRL